MELNSEILFTKHSPYMAVNAKLEDEKGNKFTTPLVYSLCRCGGSRTKPYCDGSHSENGFTGDREENEKKKIHNYKINDFIVHFDFYLCRHAEECVKAMPEVFNPHNNPWINVKDADIEKLKTTIKKCPSGALSYSENGIKETDYFSIKKIKAIKNGPYDVQGGIRLIDDMHSKDLLGTEDHYCLCRCGKSKRKPFCDSTHVDIEFKS